jgi:hypothetical protein
VPEYRRVQRRLLEIFDVERLFGEIFDPDVSFWYPGVGGVK